MPSKIAPGKVETNANYIITTIPPAGNNKKITNMWYNEDTGLPEFEVEA